MTSKESQEPKEAAGVVKSPKGRRGEKKQTKAPLCSEAWYNMGVK